MAFDEQSLRDELRDDPLGRGYAGMTNKQVEQSMNARDRDNWISIDSATLFNALDATEWASANNSVKTTIQNILDLNGSIEVDPSSLTYSQLESLLGPATIARLVERANPKRNRAQEVGFGGVVTSGLIKKLRGA